MREIKFRIRNTVNGYTDFVSLTQLLTMDNSNISPKMVNDDFQISQYTGLKDKDGVEIYTDDIITAHQFLFDGNEVESVIFGEVGSNEFGWTLKRIKNDFYEDYTGYEPYEGESNLGDFYGLHEESFEVIGNIHENPELLNTSDQ